MKELDYADATKILEKYSFNAKCNFCYIMSKDFLIAQSKEDFQHIACHIAPWDLETLAELSIRMKDGANEYSQGCLKDLCIVSDAIMKHQDKFAIAHDIHNIFPLLGMQQFDVQENLFIKLFRYNYIFTFRNDSFDMNDLFIRKFGNSYYPFANFVYIFYSIIICSSIINRFNEHDFMQIHFLTFSSIVNKLSITRKEMELSSYNKIHNLEDLPYFYKEFFIYPFIHDSQGNQYNPLPHIVPRSCMSSLLERMKYNNAKLRSDFGKHILESHIFNLVNESSVFDYCSREFSYINHKNSLLTSDVLCLKDDEILCIESKSFVPSAGIRLLKENDLRNGLDRILDGIDQLYKFMYEKYPTENSNIGHIKDNNKYGILVLFEDAHFIRQLIYNEYFKRYKIPDSKKEFIINHIKICSLYNLEVLLIQKNNVIKKIKEMKGIHAYDAFIHADNNGLIFSYDSYVKELLKNSTSMLKLYSSYLVK